MNIEESKLNDFLKQMTLSSTVKLVEDEELDDDLKEALDEYGIKMPNKDLAPFKCFFAPTDEHNLNGMMMEDKDVDEKTLKTLRGKPVNIDHSQRNVVGFYMKAKRNKDKPKNIDACGIIFKNSFREEYEQFKEKAKNGDLAFSMEAWGNREYKDLKSNKYVLRNIELAGGAILMKTKPAFPNAKVTEMASVLEIASVEDVKSFVIEKPVKESKDVRIIARVLNVSKEVFKMNELIASLKEGASEAQVKVLEQIEIKYNEAGVELAKKVEELTQKAQEIENFSALVEQLKQESEVAKANIEALEKSTAEKIAKAREEAAKITSLRAELGEEFSANMTDADLLNEDKVEIARLKKLLASKETASASAKPEVPSMVVASTQSVKAKDELMTIGERVVAQAYGSK
jgi:hypothetical protein